ncbi:MAG: hypothetical protein ACXW3W_06470 [Pyrinomonadaceae bacterium]
MKLNHYDPNQNPVVLANNCLNIYGRISPCGSKQSRSFPLLSSRSDGKTLGRPFKAGNMPGINIASRQRRLNQPHK